MNESEFSRLPVVYMPLGRIRNIKDEKFGRLRVIEYVCRDIHKVMAIWRCVCDCGNVAFSFGSLITAGLTKSCGCLQREAAARLNKKRFPMGAVGRKIRTVEFNSWASMRRRCYLKSCKDYHRYGGRGIKVCVRWRHSYDNFLADMGHRPTPNHSLDRINNNGNYEPGNCRWATRKEQQNNTRSNRKISFRGKTLGISVWATEAGLTASALSRRLAIGWSVEMALTTPKMTGGRSPKIF